MMMIKDTKSVYIKGNVTPIDVSINHLAFCAIQIS